MSTFSQLVMGNPLIVSRLALQFAHGLKPLWTTDELPAARPPLPAPSAGRPTVHAA
jgi:hypothetical protein